MKTKNTYWTIRHGQSVNNVLLVSNTHSYDLFPLTELGRKQCETAGEALKKEGIDVVYSSPFLRAKESADILAGCLGIHKIIIDESLKEMRETNEDNNPIVSFKLNHIWERSLAGEESYGELYRRITGFFEATESKYNDKKILLVTHATPQNMIDAVLGSEDEGQAKALFLAVQLSENPFRKNALAYKAASA